MNKVKRSMADNRAGIAMDTAAASLADKVTAGGAVTGVAGWLMQINWIGLIGVFVALGGFAISWYFQIKRDQREEELHRARMMQFSARRDREDE